MGKLWQIDGQSPNSPMFSPTNVLRSTVAVLSHFRIMQSIDCEIACVIGFGYAGKIL